MGTHRLGPKPVSNGRQPAWEVQPSSTYLVESIISSISKDMTSLNTLPIEVSPLSLESWLTRAKIFHNVAVYLPPKAIRALALACKETHSQIYAGGSHLWKQLFLCKYDSVRTASEGVDWMLSFQSRNWVEKELRLGFPESVIEYPDGPIWKVSGQSFLETLRDMILENGARKLSSGTDPNRNPKRRISRILGLC